jgi:hypothetical protein
VQNKPVSGIIAVPVQTFPFFRGGIAMSRHILSLSDEQLTAYDLDAFVAHAEVLNQHNRDTFTTPFPNLVCDHGVYPMLTLISGMMIRKIKRLFGWVFFVEENFWHDNEKLVETIVCSPLQII